MGVLLVWGGASCGLSPHPHLTLPHWLLCRLAPMRLYTLSKRHFVLVFVVFFVCFGLTVFVGIRGKVQFLVILSFIVTLVHAFQPGQAIPTFCHLLRAPWWRVKRHFILSPLGKG